MAISGTNFELAGQTDHYVGKVRDVYSVGDRLVVVVSDRISAFDVILPRPIPYKGQVLNQIAAKFLTMTSNIVPNWLEAVPDPNVSIGKKCNPIPIEMVIRGYLAGHAWREYRDGKRTLCGVPLPEGLKENDRLPTPIITPATKAVEGHDEDISRNEILQQEIVSPRVYALLEQYTYQLFAAGTRYARERGLILVDTKYEFGWYQDQIYLIDEVHTPDSSRYFYADQYEEIQAKGEKQKQLSKEFVRTWLMENGFQGKEGQTIPEMSDEVVAGISGRYLELYEQLIGEPLNKADDLDATSRITKNIENYFVANN